MRLVAARRVIDGRGHVSEGPAYVALENGRIVDVIQGQHPAESDELIDLGGMTLLPGLVDTHIHISGSGGFDAREKLATESEQTLLLRVAQNCRTMLRVGVTTARDCGTRNEIIFPFLAALRSGAAIGPRLLVAGAALTPTGGHVADLFGHEVDSVDAIVKAVRQHAKLGAHLIKVMTTGGILTQFKPNLLQFSQEELRTVVREAHHLGLPVASHCHNKAGIAASVDAGVDTIEHAIYADENGVRYDPDLSRRVREAGIFVNPSNAFAIRSLLTGQSDAATDGGPGLLANLRAERVATWRQQYADDVQMVPGSDAGWYATPFEDYARMPELMVSEIGMTPMEAIVACTRTAAVALGLDAEIGTVEPGKTADLIAVEGDPSVDVKALWNVRWVMKAGRQVWPDALQIGSPPVD
jgi:imidazolonepropionase-like amidohydrolase